MLIEAPPPGIHEYLTDNELSLAVSGRGSDVSGLTARGERVLTFPRRVLAPTFQDWGGASWYEPTMQAALKLTQLPEGWDRAKAPRIEPTMVVAAMSLLTSVMRDNTPVPSVVPTTRGGIQLEWHTRGIDLEVEFLSTVRVQGLFEDQRTGDSWEENLSFNLKPLTDAIANLSSR